MLGLIIGHSDWLLASGHLPMISQPQRIIYSLYRPIRPGCTAVFVVQII